jgi:hypothetical protein
MKKIKINIAVIALLLGVTAAFGFKPAPKNSKFVQVSWIRLGTAATPNANTWQQATGGTCESADRICKATFTSGYNPNSHTYTDNLSNATVTVDQGYVEQ